MRSRLLLPVLLGLGLSALSPASAGVIEDMFRKLIDQRKSSQSWIPQGLRPQSTRELFAPEISDRADGMQIGRDQYAIFVAPRCRTCLEAIARLRERGFHVEIFDVSRSEIAREAFEISGARGVPTILAGKRMLGGWSDKHFDRLIKSDFQDKANAQQGTGA
jgi:glutaredoxin